jgi:hypothetical protein
MRIENLRDEKSREGGRRVCATVVWEDSERPVHELYFETDPEFDRDLTVNPHGFLLAGLMPAMWHNEQRISIDAEICPQLRDGLKTAMALIRHWWYPKDKKLPCLEAKTRSTRLFAQHNDRRAGMFFSGGIDSLASLRKNRLLFPPQHLWSIKDGLLVFGLETTEIDKFEHVKNALNRFTTQVGLTLIPVYTNIRYLDEDWMFWQHQFQDSVYASVAHQFSQRINVISISSTYDIPHMQPDGSHPLLDVNYSSSDLTIRHDAIQMSRLDKIKLLAEWDLGLQNIRTCNKSELYQNGALNCGRCWKCVSAMLALMGLGVLENSSAFPPQELSADLVDEVIEIYKTTLCFYEDLPPLLIEKGRTDLAKVIEQKIAAYERHREFNELHKAIAAIGKRWDRRFLNGNLLRLKRKIQQAKMNKSSADR